MSRLRCSATSHVDVEGTVVDVSIVEAVDCLLRARLIGELAGAECLRAARFAIVHQSHVDNVSGLAEVVADEFAKSRVPDCRKSIKFYMQCSKTVQ